MKLFILTIVIVNAVNCMEEKKNNIQSLEHIEEHKSQQSPKNKTFTFNYPSRNTYSDSNSSEEDNIIENIPELKWIDEKKHFTLSIYISKCFSSHLNETSFKNSYTSVIIKKILQLPIKKDDGEKKIINTFNTFFIDTDKYSGINHNFEVHIQYVNKDACEKNKILRYMYHKKKYSLAQNDNCCSIF